MTATHFATRTANERLQQNKERASLACLRGRRQECIQTVEIIIS